MDLHELKPLEFYCQKVLPLVYDNSLSYYEVLCKIQFLLNQVIDNQNKIIEYFTKFKDYIDAEIERIVKEEFEKMYDDGTLKELIKEILIELGYTGGNGGSGDYRINVVQYALENNIDTTQNWGTAFNGAIELAIESGRRLYIPNGDYLFLDWLVISKEGAQALIIEGENATKTILRFKKGGLIFTSPADDITDYQKRISRVSIKDITIRKVERDNKENGLTFEKFGYITIDNIIIADFDLGIRLYNGSEFEGTNLQIYSNNVGVYTENPIGKVTGLYDLANTNFYHCRIYSNNKNIVMNNSREVNFVNCAIMNYLGACEFTGITNIINFRGCDFENQEGTNDMIVKSKGVFNFTDCSFNNARSNKIIIESDSTFNFRGCLFHGLALKTIIIKEGYNPIITNDQLYLGYYFERTKDWSNYPKGNLINIQNKYFEKGVCLPFSNNTIYSVIDISATYGHSISFSRQQTQDIQFNLVLDNFPDKVKPMYVEIICSGFPTLNPLVVGMTDGTFGINHTVGGGDATVGKITKDGVTWLKLGFILPRQDTNKLVNHLSIVIPKSTTDELARIDSINVYGEGQFTKLYADAMPTRGSWKPYELIWAKDPNKSFPTQSPTTPKVGWTCVTPREINENSTFRILTMGGTTS